MFEELMNQFKSTQKDVEKTKKRLDDVMVREQSADKMITVIVTANSEIKDVKIDKEKIDDVEQVEDYLITTINKALTKTSEIYEEQVETEAKKGLPNIPGITS